MDKMTANLLSYEPQEDAGSLADPNARMLGDHFNYDAVPARTADEMRAAAERVRQFQRNVVIEIGRQLIVIKEQIDHGKFVDWVERECQMSIRTAQRAMQAADAVEKNDKLSFLPMDGLLALASRGAPRTIVDAIVKRIDAGEKPMTKEIKALIADARNAARRDAACQREIEVTRPQNGYPPGPRATAERPGVHYVVCSKNHGRLPGREAQ